MTHIKLYNVFGFIDENEQSFSVIIAEKVPRDEAVRTAAIARVTNNYVWVSIDEVI